MNTFGCSSPVRVLLVDGHAIYRALLRRWIDEWEEVQLVAEAPTAMEALAAIEQLTPAVVITSLALVDMDAFAMTRRIRQLYPDVRVLVCSSLSKNEQEHAAVQAGASGYVEEHADPDELRLAIQVVHKGSPYFTAPV